MWLNIIDLINTRVSFYKSGLILYRKMVVNEDIVVFVRMIYIVSIEQYIISDEYYTLNTKTTLKTLISSYRKIIDDFNLISKK